MNIENVKAWVAELRNPTYPQGQARLAIITKDDDIRTECCMGVACRVAGLDETVVEEKNAFAVAFAGTNAFGYPPVALHYWLGLGHPPLVSEDGGAELFLDWPDDYAPIPYPDRIPSQPEWRTQNKALHNLNDSTGLTFDQIADLINYFGVTNDPNRLDVVIP